MAKKFCKLPGRCIDRNGKEVDSILWKDIQTAVRSVITNNNAKVYEVSKSLYLFALADKTAAKYDLSYDKNGEPTFYSLSKTDLFKEKVTPNAPQQVLRASFAKAGLTTEEADELTKVFNTNPASKEYILKRTAREKGKYDVDVVERTPQSQHELLSEIRASKLRDELIDILQQFGVSVQFFDKMDTTGRYSTLQENVKKTIDGLYTLIALRNGQTSSEQLRVLDEEVGHLIVGMLGENHELVKRFEKVLTKEVIDEIGKQEGLELKNFHDSNIQREMMGYLVGKILYAKQIERLQYEKKIREQELSKLSSDKKQIKKKHWYNIFSRLASNMWNWVKDKIEYLKKSDIERAIYNADKYALQMVGRLDENPNESELSVKNALATEETLYGTDDSYEEDQAFTDTEFKNVKSVKTALETVIQGMHRLLKTIQQVEPATDLKKVVEEQEKQIQAIEVQLNESGSDITKKDLLDLLANYINELSIYFDELSANVEDDPSSNLDSKTYFKRLSKEANDIFVQRTIMKTMDSLYYFLMNIESSIVSPTDLIGNRQKTFGFYVNQLKESVRGNQDAIAIDLFNRERRMFLNFLRNFYGKGYIDVAAHVTFDNWKIRREKEKKYTFHDLMQHMDRDIGMVDAFLKGAASSNDYILQICQLYARLGAKTIIDMDTEQLVELDKLKKRLNEMGVSQKDLFERYSKGPNKGHLTGNIISPLNHAEWENDRREFRKQMIEIWENHNPELAALPYNNQLRYTKLNEFLVSAMEKWDDGGEIRLEAGGEYKEYKTIVDAHSDTKEEIVVDEDGQPRKDGNGDILKQEYKQPKAELYTNTDYAALIANHENLKDWLEDYMNWKHNLEMAMFGYCHTHSFRAPQFKGTFCDRLVRRHNNPIKSLWDMARSTVKIDADDTDFGDVQSYDTVEEEESVLGVGLARGYEALRRIPYYGIRKLRDEDQLSTDIFMSSLLYAHMAHAHGVARDAIGILETGNSIIQQRKLLLKKQTKGRHLVSELTNLDSHTILANVKFQRFIDKFVYGVDIFGWGDKTRNWRKLILNINRAGSVYALGGNTKTAIANANMGIMQFMREGMVGEYFSTADMAWAVQEFVRMSFANVFQTGKQIKDDWVSLLIRRFDVLGKSAEDFKHNITKGVGATRVGHILNVDRFFWQPFRMGDMMMQTLPFLAVAHSTKLYTVRYNKDGDYIGADPVSLLDIYERKKDKGLHAELSIKEIYKTSEEEGGKKLYTTKDADYDVEQINDLISYLSGTAISNAESLIQTIKDYGSERQLEILKDLCFISEDDSWNYGYQQFDVSTIIESLQMKKKTLVIEDETSLRLFELSLIAKHRAISNRMHGVYNSADKSIIQSHMFTSLAMAMKGYAFGMIESRFSGYMKNVGLDTDTEGSVRAALIAGYDIASGIPKLLTSKISNPVARLGVGAIGWGIGLSLASMFMLGGPLVAATLWNVHDPEKTGNFTTRLLYKLGYSLPQIAAIKRNGVDMAQIASVQGLIGAVCYSFGLGEVLKIMFPGLTFLGGLFGIGGGKAPDDRLAKENMSYHRQVVYYFLNRLLRELTAFNQPVMLIAESKRLADVNPTNISVFLTAMHTTGMFLLASALEYYPAEYLGDGQIEVEDLTDKENWMLKDYKSETGKPAKKKIVRTFIDDKGDSEGNNRGVVYREIKFVDENNVEVKKNGKPLYAEGHTFSPLYWDNRSPKSGVMRYKPIEDYGIPTRAYIKLLESGFGPLLPEMDDLFTGSVQAKYNKHAKRWLQYVPVSGIRDWPALAPADPQDEIALGVTREELEEMLPETFGIKDWYKTNVAPAINKQGPVKSADAYDWFLTRYN